MISISPTEYGVKKPSIVPSSALNVILPFDKIPIWENTGTADCSYYLELLDNGFKEAAKFKAVPLDTLLNIIEKFKQGGCKNEWIHKKKRFKAEDLEVTLACEFTTNYFQLVAIIGQISTKKQLVKGIVMKTEAGTSIHEGMYKDMIVDKEIVITDSSDSPRIIIKKANVFEGKLNYQVIGDKEIKEIISFDL